MEQMHGSKPLNRQEILSILSPYESTFSKIVTDSFDEAKSLSKSCTKIIKNLTFSILMWNLNIENAKKYFDDSNLVRYKEENSLFVLIINKQLFIKFNKLNNNLRTYSKHSKRSQAFNSQENIFPDLPVLVPSNITMGYTLNKEKSEIKLYFVSPSKTNNGWFHELRPIPIVKNSKSIKSEIKKKPYQFHQNDNKMTKDGTND